MEMSSRASSSKPRMKTPSPFTKQSRGRTAATVWPACRPPGRFTRSVGVPEMNAYRKEGVALKAREEIRLDVRLEDGPSLRTLGEDPAAILATMRVRPPAPQGPVTRMPNGKADLTGVWSGGCRCRLEAAGTVTVG